MLEVVLQQAPMLLQSASQLARLVIIQLLSELPRTQIVRALQRSAMLHVHCLKALHLWVLLRSVMALMRLP